MSDEPKAKKPPKLPSRELFVDGRMVVVTLTAEGLTFRQKGKRTSYLLPYETALWQAERLAGEAAYQAKKRAPRVKRGLLSL